MKKILLTTVILAAFTVSLFAQADANKTEIGQSSEDLTALQVANDLARYGYSVESSSALIGAAEIYSQVRTQPLGVQPERSQGALATPAAREFDPAALLRDARRFAGSDTTMLTWASEVERALNTQTRGAVGGPKYDWDVIRGREEITYRIDFRANQIAEAVVLGDGSTYLDIYVYDRNWNLVVYTDVYTSGARALWVPSYTGVYHVRIVNWGTRNNLYEFFTN